MFCHDSYPALVSSLASLEKFFPYDLPLGIDCERCHGPGEEHVKLVASNSSLEMIRGAVFQPAHASRQQQRELCYQCHFEAGVPFARDRVFRPEGDAFSYRPGEPLWRFIVNLDYAPKDRPSDEFKIVGQGYRLEQSVCFEKSSGTMTCTTCHDPHRSVPPGSKAQWFRSRCLQCHRIDSCGEIPTARNRQNDDCTACHMWKRRPEDAVHTIFTDHKIQKIRPNRNFLAPLAERDQAVMNVSKDLIVHPGQGLDLLEQEYFLGMAYLQLPPDQLVMSESQRDKGVHLLEKFLKEIEQAEKKSRYATYISRAYLTLASSYRARGRRDDALKASEGSLKYDGPFALALNFKCGLLTELGRSEEAFECFQRSSALNPWDGRVYRSMGSLFALNGLISEAIALFQQSLSVNPDDVEAYHYLGDVQAEKGDLDAAVSAYERALTLEPRDPETYWDCALALQRMGRNDLALRYTKNGLRYVPLNPRGLDLLSTIRGSAKKTGVEQK